MASKALLRQEGLHLGDTLTFSLTSKAAQRSLTVVGVVGGENLIGGGP